MITSTSNPKIKNLMQLQKKGKARREQQCFVVEGIKMVLEAPEDRLKEIYMSESFSGYSEYREAVLKKAKAAGAYAEIVSDKVFRDTSDTMTPQGVMAVVASELWDWKTLVSKKTGQAKLFLILESLQDPGNLGTVIRTGEGAGIDGIILNRTTVDPYMPKVIRSTMGSAYRVPVAAADDLTEVVSEMRRQGIGVYAAHLQGSEDYCRKDYTKATCFMIGNEASGLTDRLTEMASGYIRIPMAGQVESLNAGIAAALLMYEAKRQRNFQ